MFGGATISYDINENLVASYRYGIDVYSENNTNYANKGGKTGSVVNRNGLYETWNNRKTIFDHNFTVSGQYNITEEIGADFTVGFTTRSDTYDRNGVRSSGQQVFNVIRHFNYEQQDEIQFYNKRNIMGLYGQASFDYNRYAYLTLAARKDWVSNLLKKTVLLFTSASVSFLPTSAFPEIKSDMVNLLKIRAGYGTSANFPTGYPLQQL